MASVSFPLWFASLQLKNPHKSISGSPVLLGLLLLSACMFQLNQPFEPILHLNSSTISIVSVVLNDEESGSFFGIGRLVWVEWLLRRHTGRRWPVSIRRGLSFGVTQSTCSWQPECSWISCDRDRRLKRRLGRSKAKDVKSVKDKAYLLPLMLKITLKSAKNWTCQKERGAHEEDESHSVETGNQEGKSKVCN